ncbi:expressed unknown protein [Seminavis robusta]|uniref:Uncharacterized protein n=1 Tax=Seminavis robusta TaxID=568900 RepID=A0A9N8E0N7_9STRA|nr:expressed unknown protein [Seminavis robusta]|eukprot:Sro392_g133290.1 n/a (1141) ;mRNA; f:10137-13694
MAPNPFQTIANMDVVLNRDGSSRAEGSSNPSGEAVTLATSGKMGRDADSVMRHVSSVAGPKTYQDDVASSVGSYAPTLATNKHHAGLLRDSSTNNHSSIMDCSNRARVSDSARMAAAANLATAAMKDQSEKEDESVNWNDGVSSVGSFAPTLAKLHSSKASLASTHVGREEDNSSRDENSREDKVEKELTDSNLSIEYSDSTDQNTAKRSMGREANSYNEDDMISSVGSFAPTLANKSTAGGKTAATKELNDDSFHLQQEQEKKQFPSSYSVVSSVGSFAPTLATKGTVKTLKNQCIGVDGRHADDYDDGVSSIGMSKAPTLATHRSKFTSTPSTAFKHKDVRVEDDEVSADYSALGSRAPTLSGKSPGRQPSSMPKSSLRSSNTKKKETKEAKDVFSAADSGLSFDHYASDMALLGGVLGRENLKSGLEDVVGSFLRKGAIAGFCLWLFLLVVIVCVAPLKSYQYMNGPEQIANVILLTLLLVVNFNRIGPYLVNDRNYNFLTSGAMMASCVVQAVAIFSVLAMLILPTPVIIDPVVGVRCHLVRWAEWTALSFVMTFLTESIDLPLEDASAKHAWFTASMIALSTVCGGVLGFCPNVASWWLVFSISCALFSVLYLRLLWRGFRLLRMPKAVTTSDKEDYERAKYAFKLLIVCTCIWTFLVVAWTVCALAYQIAEPGSFWANDWLILAVENFSEALSKIGYLSILLEVHELLFDDVSHTARRLSELRAYMSAVWDASTDVVVICSSHNHLVNAAVSPSFFQMESAFGYYKPLKEKPGNISHEQTTLVMEVDPYEGSYRTYEMNLSKPMSRHEADAMMKNSRKKARMVTPVYEKNLKVLSDLVCDACAIAVPDGQKQYEVIQDFYCLDQYRNQEVLTCQAKVVKLKDKAFLIVLRDVTPRHYIEESPGEVESAHMGSNASVSYSIGSRVSSRASSSRSGHNPTALATPLGLSSTPLELDSTPLGLAPAQDDSTPLGLAPAQDDSNHSTPLGLAPPGDDDDVVLNKHTTPLGLDPSVDDSHRTRSTAKLDESATPLGLDPNVDDSHRTRSTTKLDESASGVEVVIASRGGQNLFIASRGGQDVSGGQDLGVGKDTGSEKLQEEPLFAKAGGDVTARCMPKQQPMQPEEGEEDGNETKKTK